LEDPTPENKVKRVNTKVLSTSDLAVVDAGDPKALKMGKGRDCWYNNSWVCTDLLMLPIFITSLKKAGLLNNLLKQVFLWIIFRKSMSALYPCC